MTYSPDTPRPRRWTLCRRAVQVAALLLFLVPVLVAGWLPFGASSGGDNPVTTPADLPFYGTLSSSTIAGLPLLDPFGMLQIVAATKTFAFDWLLAALPVLIVYALIRGRAFCGWVCPVNLLLEGIDALRRRLGIEVREMPIPRHAKLWIALGVIVASAIAGVALFEVFSPISAINKGLVLGSTVGLTVLAAVVLIELFWGHRTWCRSLCPLGGFYEAIGRVGMVNVTFDRTACIHCDACKKTCLCDPTILDPVLTERDTVVRAGDCMACGSCVDACPTRALKLSVGKR